jgi:hypothetical protein
MALTFYPYTEDAQKGTLSERIDTLMEAAERYKAVVLDTTTKKAEPSGKRMVPREQGAVYNWDEIAKVLREVREMQEGSKVDKTEKARLLKKLAEVYEVLRGAKMSKLEAVRLALISEATNLEGAEVGEGKP